MMCVQVTLLSANCAGRSLVVLAAMALLAGCHKTSPPDSLTAHRTNGTPHQLTKADLSEAEQKYGVAPIPDPSVTYQPDVILVGGGPEAIRELNPNGFMWTIDAGAPRANELVPGKIFFMTGRAVGRVLDVRKDGGNLVVTVGPVELTDIIREAHIHIDSMPVNFGDALAYTSPDLPGQFVPLTRAAGAAAAMPAKYAGHSEWRFVKTQAATAPTAAAPIRNYNEKNFKTTPFVSPSDIGIKVSVDDDGFKLSTQAVLHLSAPHLTVKIDITPTGGVETAAMVLTGAAGLNWDFATGSGKTMTAIVSALLQPNTDFSIPIAAVGGVPLAITVRQRFLIRTGLAVKNSTLSATGGYTFNGAFKVGYLHKYWTAEAPTDYTTEQSMTKTGAGISLGIQGLDLSDTVRVFMGLGAFGFATGPYLSFNSAIGAFRNSSIGMLQCNGATLVVKLSGGVGYVIPKSVTELINSVLKALNINYEITGQGGLEPSKPYTVIEKTSQLGGCNVDKDPGETGTVRGGP